MAGGRWSKAHCDADEALLAIINREIAFNQYFKEESAAFGMRYFDTSHAFAQTIEEVVAYVRGEA